MLGKQRVRLRQPPSAAVAGLRRAMDYGVTRYADFASGEREKKTAKALLDRGDKTGQCHANSSAQPPLPFEEWARLLAYMAIDLCTVLWIK